MSLTCSAHGDVLTSPSLWQFLAERVRSRIRSRYPGYTLVYQGHVSVAVRRFVSAVLLEEEDELGRRGLFESELV